MSNRRTRKKARKAAKRQAREATAREPLRNQANLGRSQPAPVVDEWDDFEEDEAERAYLDQKRKAARSKKMAATLVAFAASLDPDGFEGLFDE